MASALVVRRLTQIGPMLDSEDRSGRRSAHATVRCTRRPRDPALTAMGTTVAGVVVTADLVLVFNVGDSRVYAAGPGGVRQLSTDDRLSGNDLPPGIVTHALGGSDELNAVDPHLPTSPLSEDTSYLICTDGLTDPMPVGVLNEVLREHEDGRAVFELWRARWRPAGQTTSPSRWYAPAPNLPPCWQRRNGSACRASTPIRQDLRRTHQRSLLPARSDRGYDPWRDRGDPWTSAARSASDRERRAGRRPGSAVTRQDYS